MRVATAALATLVCTASTAAAQSQFTFSIGAMQRSYSADATIVIDNSNPILSSDDTQVLGMSADMHLTTDQNWVRLMLYSDTFDTTLTNSNGLGLDVQPGGIGLFGAFPFTGEFERNTSLMRFDAMQQVSTFGDFDLYGGLSLVDIQDQIRLVVTTSSFPGVIGNSFVHGQSSLIGAVIGGRYDIDPSFGPDGLNLSAFGTLAVYNGTHTARYDATATGPGAPATDERASATTSGITSAAELGLTASYALSEATTLSLTYQAAFYGDAVNTPASVGLTNRSGGPSTAVVTDSILYQGLSLSYVMRF